MRKRVVLLIGACLAAILIAVVGLSLRTGPVRPNLPYPDVIGNIGKPAVLAIPIDWCSTIYLLRRDSPENYVSVRLPEHLLSGRDPCFKSTAPLTHWEWHPGCEVVTYRGMAESGSSVSGGVFRRDDCADIAIEVTNRTERKLESVYGNVCLCWREAPDFVDKDMERTYVVVEDRAVTLSSILPPAPPGRRRIAVAVKGAPAIELPASEFNYGWRIVPNVAVDYPFIMVRSRDGARIIALAFGPGAGLDIRFNGLSRQHGCMHANPLWGTIQPGERKKIVGRVYFFDGTPDQLLVRYRKDVKDSLLRVESASVQAGRESH